jgi:hypothetical protein
MWPSAQWWSDLGFIVADRCFSKTLPNKWKLCITSKLTDSIPLAPPVDGDKILIRIYEPDGNQTVVTFGMNRNSNINPETFLAALVERIEEQILA